MLKKIKPAWVDEFKKFALKGNVVDMAIGVIIGGAFSKIVTSLVKDIITPAISMLTGDTKNLAELSFALSDAKDAPVIKYGVFCQTVLDFIIIALTIFWAVRLICKLRAKKAEPAPEPPAPAPTPEDILLLREIRDALKNK
ncbi:MAG: large-conductance mechanosensitive channel protein MscL [Akkermansia sp.]|nr:large-conductance mechanosensitive channel protein MscL [Akkermansia sp.]